MRASAILAWGAAAVALALGFAGRASGVAAFDVVAGLLWLVALVAVLSLLPLWGRIIPPVPAMTDLFRRPLEGERWCASCGSPAPTGGECPACDAPAPVRRRAQS